ncbi:hypothetical protein EG68_02361 [Paragonimus skrjabini miyazakii]|uniref:RRM domain-containing protein n=1 Tax=Paragonimus skrjabini miyazakii TaxID=59628 RepID=A0A8S9YY26_9TREM|nr:hypothetical protein EG68_02361 [Paragonimus skrjabini miyazakii]
MPRRSTSLYVRHLPDTCRHEDLRRAFGRYGRIVDITIPLDFFTGRMKGFAFIEYPFHLRGNVAFTDYLLFCCVFCRLSPLPKQPNSINSQTIQYCSSTA